MTSELEERLAALEKELAESKKQHRPAKRSRRSKLTRRSRVLLACTLLVVVLALTGVLVHRHIQATYTPVPASIRNSVPFPVYYPDKKKLPSGFVLDTTSFSHNEDAVIYTVSHGADRITFSVQAPVSITVLSDFNTKQIPLHTTVSTPFGNATKGAVGQRSVVSLPIDNSAWIIVTGPDTLSDRDTSSLLGSLRR